MDERDITLPVDLIEGDLKLHEIGALCVLMSAIKMSEQAVLKWNSDDFFQETINDLERRNFVVTVNGDITINLETENIKENMEKYGDIEYDSDFWGILKYAVDDNPIFYHRSNIGDEDGNSYGFKFSPILRSGRVEYDDISDAGLKSGDTFFSLEEAKNYVKLQEEGMIWIKEKLKPLVDWSLHSKELEACLDFWGSMKGEKDVYLLRAFASGILTGKSL